MNFENNYAQAIALQAGVTTASLDLPDGDYRLTLSDSQDSPTRWEIVLASVVAGSATLTRAQEGTTDQLWPVGSVIYCAVTAGTMGQIMTVIEVGGLKGDKGDTGDPGPAIELQKSTTYIQWRVVGGLTWIDLVPLSDLMPTTQSVVNEVIAAIGSQLVPAGGTDGQSLVKASADNFDTAWAERVVPAAVDRLLSVSYDPVTTNMRTGVRDTSTMEFSPIDTSFAGPYLGEAGMIGYSKSAGLAVLSPTSANLAFTLGASDLSVVVSSTDFSQQGGVYVSPDGVHGTVSGYSGVSAFTPATMLAAPGTSDALGTTPRDGASGFFGVGFSPDSSIAYCGHNTGVVILNTADWSLIENRAITGGARGLNISTDGARAVARQGASVKVWSTVDWSEVATITGISSYPNYGHATAFHPDDNSVVIVLTNVDGSGNGSARVYSLTDVANPVILSPSVGAGINVGGGNSVAFSSDRTLMYLACYLGVHVFNTADWSYVSSFDLDLQNADIAIL